MVWIHTNELAKRIVSAVLTVIIVFGIIVFSNNLQVSAHSDWRELEDYGMAYLAGSDSELEEAENKTIQLERTIDYDRGKVVYTVIFNHGHESWNAPYEYVALPSELTNASIVSYDKTPTGEWTKNSEFATLSDFSGAGKYKYEYPSNDFNTNFDRYFKNMWNADGSFNEIDAWKTSGKYKHMLMWQTGWNTNAYKWVITMDIPENVHAGRASILVGMCTWNDKWARGAVIGPHFGRDKYDVSGGTITEYAGKIITDTEILSLASTNAPNEELGFKLIEKNSFPGGVIPNLGKISVPVRIAYTDGSSHFAYVKINYLPNVKKHMSQVRFTVNSPTTVDDEFFLRIVSYIPANEWSHYFGNTAQSGATNNYITSAGIVAYKGAASSFDRETALNVINGTPAENYGCAETTYFQKETNTSDAYFGAKIKVKHSILQNDITYLCWVKYVDDTGTEQLAAYDAVQQAAVVSQYNNLVSRYIAAYPYHA